MLTPVNWDALVQIGHRINERLLTHQLEACQCAPDATTLERVVLPSTTDDGLPAPACASANRARWRCSPACAPSSTCSPDLQPLAARADLKPDPRPPRATDDLRPAPPQTQRIHPAHPPPQRDKLTIEGRRPAVFFTKTYTRIVNPSTAELDPGLPDKIADRAPLATAWRAYERALNTRIAETAITA